MGRKGRGGRKVRMQGMPRGGLTPAMINQAINSNMFPPGTFDEGMSDAQKRNLITQAMSAAQNPAAMKIAQKVEKRRKKKRGKKGKKGKKGKPDVREMVTMIGDELTNEAKTGRSFGMPSQFAQPPQGGLPVDFPGVPEDVKVAYEGQTRECEQCNVRANCLHDPETNKWLCGTNCYYITKQLLNIAEGTNLCFKPDCMKIASLRCGGCKEAWYCNAECQRWHWKNGHKKICRIIKKKRAEAEEEIKREEEQARIKRSERRTQQATSTNEPLVHGPGGFDPHDMASLMEDVQDDDDDEEEGWIIEPTEAEAQLPAAIDAINMLAAANNVNDTDEIEQLLPEDDDE